tara:strand:+ start:188 stop:646 length:459 start_codon:yes stop_codon:yes gene_type:complete
MNIQIKDNKVIVTGKINQPFTKAKLFAANPIDRMNNYSGSGLPFPCYDIAFDNTPNIKHINSGNYGATFEYPNSYYMPNGRDKVPPTIYLSVDDKIIEAKELVDPLPLKTLTHRGTNDREKFVSYKNNNLPIKNQDEVMVVYKNMKLSENIF